LGIHTFDHHKHPEWTVKEADVLRYALSQDQLNAFFLWEVPEAPNGGGPRTGVMKARDLFCVQCTTGVRIGDLKQVIDQYNENPERQTFSVHMKKTDASVVVPVMELVHQVAARYGGKLPETGALSRLNKLLRSAAKLSGLFEEKMLKPVLDDNGQRKMQEVEQWELVTSHAARRTFATYLVSKGVATRTVMSMTGHKVESEFNKYVNMNAVETALAVKQLAGL
jgi:site-specific recombinase XerD